MIGRKEVSAKEALSQTRVRPLSRRDIPKKSYKCVNTKYFMDALMIFFVRSMRRRFWRHTDIKSIVVFKNY